MPWHGRFMCPLAMAKLGLRYLSTNVFVKSGHPLRNPRRMALRRVEILGLHRDWWANLTALAQVCMECVNIAMVTPGCVSLASIGRCGARPSQGQSRGRTVGPGAVHTFVRMDRVHKLVLGYLNPRKITTPLNITSHFSSSKITLHPALQRGLILMREAMLSEETICPVITVGRPRIWMSHTCVDWICFPSGKLIVRGFTARCLLLTSAPAMMKMEVAPVLAMA